MGPCVAIVLGGGGKPDTGKQSIGGLRTQTSLPILGVCRGMQLIYQASSDSKLLRLSEARERTLKLVDAALHGVLAYHRTWGVPVDCAGEL